MSRPVWYELTILLSLFLQPKVDVIVPLRGRAKEKFSLTYFASSAIWLIPSTADIKSPDAPTKSPLISPEISLLSIFSSPDINILLFVPVLKAKPFATPINSETVYPFFILSAIQSVTSLISKYFAKRAITIISRLTITSFAIKFANLNVVSWYWTFSFATSFLALRL